MSVVRDPAKAQMLAEEILALLQKGVIERVAPYEKRAGFYSIYFFVPKKGGGICPILDLRRLNTFMKILPFKMLNATQILDSVEKERVVHHSGSEGHLLSHTHLYRALTLTLICFPGSGLSVQCPAIWPFPLTTGVYQEAATALSLLQMSWMKILPYLDTQSDLTCAVLGFQGKCAEKRPRQQAVLSELPHNEGTPHHSEGDKDSGPPGSVLSGQDK